MSGRRHKDLPSGDVLAGATSGSAGESAVRGRRGARRLLLVVLGAALAVGVLVVVPAYLSTRAAFIARFPSLEDVYGSWSQSSHAEVGCQVCHVPPRMLPRVGYRLAMTGRVYLSVFSAAAPDVFATPTNDACLECHNDLRTVSPKGDLQIPHRAHVTILEMQCVRCHEYLVHRKSPSGGHDPTMEGCLECHDGERAKDSCSACHTQKAAPASHAAADWLIVHAEESTSPACAGCHDWSGDWCVHCHSNRPRSHGPDWRAVHGARVSEHRSCEACHDGAFCIRCHGVVPPLNLDPDLLLVE